MNNKEIEYFGHIKELIKCVSIDKLLKYALRRNCAPEILFTILEEYRRKVATGKYAIKNSQLPIILEIAKIIYESGNEDDHRKIYSIIDDIDLFREGRKMTQKDVYWGEIFKQCEEANEKYYQDWLAEKQHLFEESI
jgi:hypothetical protein